MEELLKEFPDMGQYLQKLQAKREINIAQLAAFLRKFSSISVKELVDILLQIDADASAYLKITKLDPTYYEIVYNGNNEYWNPTDKMGRRQTALLAVRVRSSGALDVKTSNCNISGMFGSKQDPKCQVGGRKSRRSRQSRRSRKSRRR